MKINYGPREKLEDLGISSLSDEEVLAILIKTGSKNNDVLSLSKKILEEISNISTLNDYTFQELMSFTGIGKAKAMTIVSAIELANRIKRNKTNIKTIKKPKDIVDYIRNDYINLSFEKVEAIYISSNYKILSKTILSEGEFDRVSYSSKEILKRALKLNAKHVVIVHNHPQGYPYPSKEDYKAIEDTEKILIDFDITLFDSIVLTDNTYFSMKYSIDFKEI